MQPDSSFRMEARFKRLEILIVCTHALDKLIALLENVLYGEIERDDGVCTLYDQIDELIKNLQSFRSIGGKPNYDSDLHAFDIEISCAIQDLVRGPPILLSLIPWELQHFRTGMLGPIKVLIDSSPSMPNLVSTVIDRNANAHDHASKKKPNIDSQVGDDVDIRHKAINKDNGRFNVVGKNESPLAEDVANVDKPDSTFQEFSTSAGVVIAEYDIPKSADKVRDADGKQAHSPMLIDTITLFELVDVVKTEHLISLRATTYVLRPISSFHHFAPISMMVEDSKSGLLLWFNILSPVLKHEWEPPP
ncbi:unnamed protein product [Cuscuta campestris]|uniref:Uncharacterized protein n=1 Tax=Cuscuta campestris TaxID=132261 RepID=A0A484N4Z7_9ASTE|nr:unnamed protein product [Cuscuta campestris]